MASTLTAFPVGKGDAFLLERDDATILVDGGQAHLGFPQMLGRHPDLTKIDIAVCTHADADHANGILGLLESCTVQVKEVWLPGRWTDYLGKLLSMPRDFVYGLADDVRRADPDELRQFVETTTDSGEVPSEGGHPWDEQPSSPFCYEAAPGYDEAPVNVDDAEGRSSPSIEKLEEAFEASHEAQPSVLDGGVDPLYDELDLIVYARAIGSNLHAEALIRAIETAGRIRSIARAAWNAGARIRWFDYEEAQRQRRPGGGTGYLRPLNAVEMSRLRMAKPPTLLRCLHLSITNRESLVFMSGPDEHGCGVLFTADSDLGSSDLAPLGKYSDLVVTAPHHGATANQGAYDKVQKAHASSTLHWVRSDANYRKRPCDAYVQQPSRFCTLCRDAPQPKQLVSLTSGGGAGWSPAAGVRGCQCMPLIQTSHRTSVRSSR